MVSKHGWTEYITKYVTKSEKKSDRVKATLKHCRRKVNSATSNIGALKRIVLDQMAQRDISHQECVWEVLGLPLYQCPGTRFINVSFSNGRMTELRSGRTAPNILDSYASRSEEINDLSLYEFVKTYNHKTLNKTGNLETSKWKDDRVVVVWKSQPKKQTEPEEWLKYEIVKYKPWHERLDTVWSDFQTVDDMNVSNN